MQPTYLSASQTASNETGSAASVDRLQRIREIASLINAGSELATVLDQVVYAVCQSGPWARSGIMAVNRESGFSELVTRFDPAPSDDPRISTRWVLSRSPSLRVVETRRPVVIEDAQLSPEFPDYQADAILRGYRTVVVLPLGCTNAQGHEMVLGVQSLDRMSVTSDEIDFLTTVTHLAAIAVDKAKSLRGERMLNARLQRMLELNSSLLERVLAGSTVETIAGIVGTILPNPVVVLDFTADGAYVSRSPEPQRIGDREWGELVRGVALRELTRIVQGSDPVDFRQTRRVDLTALGVPLDREAFVEPLRVDGETVGGLLIFPQQGGLDEVDILIAQEAKFALSVQLMRSHVELKRTAQDRAELFELLCEGQWSDLGQITAQAARLGCALDARMRLVAVAPAPRKEEREPSRTGDLERALSRIVRQSVPGGYLIARPSALFLCIPDTKQPFDRFAATLGRQIIDVVKWQSGGQAIIAVGPVCARAEDYREAHRQCLRILTLAGMFERSGVLRQEDFGPFALLLSAVDATVVQTFVDDTVGVIEAYDRAHATDLLKTAEAFIEQGCRYQMTSDYLAIHVSTLRYRLKRLKELFNVDLDDAETRFGLALAFRLRAMTGDGEAGR